MASINLRSDLETLVVESSSTARNTLLTLLIIPILILFPFSVFAKKLHVGIIQLPPVYYLENNKPSGDGTEIINRLLNEMKIDYEIKMYPPKRVYSMLSSGNVDFVIALKGVKTYHHNVIYSKTPKIIINLNVYTLDPNLTLPKQKEEFSEKQVILIRGLNYGGWVEYLMNPENKVDAHLSNSHKSAVLMLKEKRAPLLLNYHGPMKKVLKEVDLPQLRYSSMKSLELYLILTKQVKDNQKLMGDMEKSYEKLRNNGMFNDLTRIELDES